MENQNSPLQQDPQMKQYFDSLPAYVQENIMQTGVELCNMDQLRSCAENLMRGE